MVVDLWSMIVDLWDIIEKNLGTAINVATLICWFVMIYYTRKTVLIDLRKKHTEDLAEFIEEWIKKLPERYELLKNHNVVDVSRLSAADDREVEKIIEKIEDDLRFHDLLSNHLPKNCKNLKTQWDDYKQNINNFKKLKERFYNKIKNYLIDIKNNYPNIKFERYGEVTISETIYNQVIYYNKYKKLKYSNDFSIGNGKLWFAGTLIATGNTEQLTKVKEIFEALMFDENHLSKHSEAREIIKLEEELEKECRNLKEILKRLKKYPLLPGTCEFLKT